MIWLVCGGRLYTDAPFLCSYLDALRQCARERVTHLIHGNASGADQLADEWAASRGIQPVACRALWETNGYKAAGPIRNGAMILLKPNVVIAFPGYKGTPDMMRQAQRAGIYVHEVDLTNPTPAALFACS